MIAIIPARGGSQRVPRKNVQILHGHPLLAWTILAAHQSGVFSEVLVATDDPYIASLATLYHAQYRLRPPSSDTETDYQWLRPLLAAHVPRPVDFALLRPTSPFRQAATIQRAYRQWQGHGFDSLRAVRLVTETPYKMWRSTAHAAVYVSSYPMVPILDATAADGTPLHSSPTQTHHPVYLQTGALELGWTRNVEQLGSISGRKIAPFLCNARESADINTPDDLARARAAVAADPTLLPPLPLVRLPADPAA
jgi:CMP-N,N'-diacetyllegionaminic acid synthase